MSDDFVPRLTGGILFSLLLRERKQRYTKQENTEGKSDGLSDQNILQALLQISDPNVEMPSGKSPKTNTSQFKTCKSNSTTWYPLLSTDFINEFESQFKNNYHETLIRTNNLFKNYIDKSLTKLNRLGRSILDFINKDDSIPDDAVFYIQNGTEGIKKTDMLPNLKYELQPLFLGVWYYLISNKIENTNGFDTFNQIHSTTIDHGTYDIVFELNDSQYKDTLITVLSETDSRFDLEEQKKSIVPDTPYDFSIYLKKVEDKYKDVKTFLYKNSPKYFYDFFVCSNMATTDDFIFPFEIEQEFLEKRGQLITDASSYKLYSKYGNFLLITANGGMGKSMMMRHLFLDSILNYNSNKVLPIFVQLKDYPNTCEDLLDFIFNNVYVHDMTIDQLKYVLSNGKAIVFLDGLDEIKNSAVSKFEKQLENFTDKYSTSIFIMSSRPYKDFSVHARFKEITLLPLNRKQSLELIDKLKFREDDPSIKEDFINKLKNQLFKTHKEFASNPLLLTIMLVTFEYYRDIPSKMHKFYHDAYEALAWRHDTSKTSFKREWNTGLNPDEFAEYLAEFCFRTYYKEKFEFTYEEGMYFFNDLKLVKANPKAIKYKDFINDLAHNMGLIYFESGKYHFTHRSFQEYFCARYLSKQKDATLEKIGMMFDKKSRRHYSDQTFPMLYDIIKDKVEQYIFIPYLENIVKRCEENEGLLTYIKMIYPKLSYSKGEVEGAFFYHNTPSSFIFSFIKKINRIPAMLELDNLLENVEIRDEFVEEWFTWATVELDDDGNTEETLVSSRQLVDEENDYDVIEQVGWILTIDTAILDANRTKYDDIISLLISDDSPLQEEYQEIKKLLKQYQDKYTETDSDDLYDLI